MRSNGNVVLRSRDPSVLAKAWSGRADAEAAPSPGDGKVSLCRGPVLRLRLLEQTLLFL